MNLTITDSALNQLAKVPIPQGVGLRIDADISGGCSSTVDIHLVLDEPRKNDTILEADKWLVYIDHFTNRYLEEPLIIDFDSHTGFSLYQQEELICQTSSLELVTHDARKGIVEVKQC